MILNEIKGDLFGINDNLAHCISQDVEMGKGIALIFKQKFGQVISLKKQINTTKNGQCIYIMHDNKFIFYLVTKKKYWNKPTYESLKSSLLELKEIIVKNNITTLSIPKIGCGLDRLNWILVKNIIMDIFNDYNIIINVYYI